MNPELPQSPPTDRPPGIRWWPAAVVACLVAIAWIVIRSQDLVPYQQRNLQCLGAGLIGSLLLLLWWMAFSRVRWSLRFTGLGLVLVLIAGGVGLFRISGVDGDLVPIIEPRWARRPATVQETPRSQSISSPSTAPVAAEPGSAEAWPAFPQFLGPHRNAVLDGPALNPDWKANPPRLIWRQPIGAAWSGFAIVGHRAFTQEQGGDEELITCYDLKTGQRVWRHAEAAHYKTTIAGEGPRCTPTVVSNRVYALGATGILNCLDAATGAPLWRRVIAEDAGSKTPDWGFSGSPLVQDRRVYVSAGGKPDRSLLAYEAATGNILWKAGGASVSHSSPMPAVLAGQPQILMFNSRRITSHDQGSGRVLWEYPWGVGQPHVAMPIAVGTNQVLFSSGYGVGSELLVIRPGASNALAASRLWKSNRMKAKFSNLVVRDGFLYGLDDGVLACVDVKDGSLRWKEGRYGHGQGLLIGDLYLLMAEGGDLVLLRPTPEKPNELAQFHVFTDKTWNPIALSGPWLLVRNDREAACLQLSLKK